jgi:hypothetical protein
MLWALSPKIPSLELLTPYEFWNRNSETLLVTRYYIKFICPSELRTDFVCGCIALVSKL